MLAEPRRRQKICPDPRGLNWSRDEGKYGHKMLERMGWKKGKGLGAKLHGNTDPIAVRKKTTMQGVGFSAKDDDNWIAHQDEFNSLLSQLNAANNGSDSEGSQVQSLTSNSENAKGRLHYKKFSQGKDLSLRKSNELECVFGVRKKKPKTEEEKEEETKGKKEIPENEAFTVSTTSVHDYFAQKMAKLRSRGYTMTPPVSEPSSDCDEERAAFSQQPADSTTALDCCSSEQPAVTEEKSLKTKKKSKKRKIADEDKEEEKRKEKKKKKKATEESEENVTVESETGKKKKKKKSEQVDNESVTDDATKDIPKKKKKKKV